MAKGVEAAISAAGFTQVQLLQYISKISGNAVSDFPIE
jgi:hypothetical protein